MTPGEAGLLVAAGFGAGFVNGVAGGGSLLSFPALVATGQSPLVANVTSTVGIWPGYIGGVAGHRVELAGQRARVRRAAPITAAGAVAGSALLLTTPEDAFATAAPYLILFACALFAVQPALASSLKVRETAIEDERLSVGLVVGMFLAGGYGAYFGGGLGVVLLAVLGLTLNDRLARLNGLRGVLALVVNTVALIAFGLAAPVDWRAAGVMAVASLAGGYLGARVARRVPSRVLRVAVITFGVAAAVKMLIG